MQMYATEVNIPNNVCCRSIFAYDSTGFLARSAKFFSDGVKVSIQTMSESGRQAITKSASLQEVASRGVGLVNESKVHEVIFYHFFYLRHGHAEL